MKGQPSMREPARLVIVGGSRNGQVIPLAGPVTTLGRAATCQVVIEDSFASRHHAQIAWRNDRYWLRDLESKNGTLLDGEAVTGEVPLPDGATIQIGDSRLRFHDPGATMTHPGVLAAESVLRVDSATRQVWLYGQCLSPPLSPKQFELLLYLWQRAGQAVPKDEIAAAVWPEAGGIVYDYQVDKLVSRLRERLRSPADAGRSPAAAGRSPDETERMGHSSAGVGHDAGSADDAETEGLIETVWGYGYRLNI
jgi:hypothetical protein